MKKSVATTRLEALRPPRWDLVRLRSILKNQMKRRILVIGDVGVDRYTIGTVERISPEAPVPIVLVQQEQLKLGLAANVAENVHALGGTPLLVGVIGRDRSAQDFRKLLRDAGIAPAHLVEDGGRRTVLKERVVSERQQLLRVDYESSAPLEAAVETQILRRIDQLIKKSDAVILEDYAKGIFTERMAKALFARARAAGKVVAVDPNSKTPLEFYRGAHVLTPNTMEAEKLAGIPIRDEDSLIRAGRKILKATAAQHVVITRGKEGMAIFSADSKVVRLIPTYAREVYDVSGAGDTVISVLTLALAGGSSIEEAAILGNLAAGVEVGKRGTATVTVKEIEVALDFFAVSQVMDV